MSASGTGGLDTSETAAVARLRPLAWAVAIVLGGVQVAAHPYLLSSADIVSYLDVADQYAQQHWAAAINGYWSPLYSWILALGLGILRPSGAWEFPMVRAFNFVIYLCSLAAFDLLLHRVAAARERARTESAAHTRDVAGGPPHTAAPAVPARLWAALGYLAFFLASLVWIGLRSDTPDMATSALCYLAGAMVVGTGSDTLGWRGIVAMPVVAAFLYFSKAAMFPVALVLVLVGTPARGRAWMATIGTSAARLAVFALVVAPFVAAISMQKGRLTIGDAGRLNYAWIVNPGGYFIPDEHWQGDTPPEFGKPIHASRAAAWRPAVFTFDKPQGGTYPPWNDPSYWYQGLQNHFDAAREWRVVRVNIAFYFEMFFAAALALYAVLFALGTGWRSLTATITRGWRLILPAAAGLGTYGVATNLSFVDIPTQPSTRYVAAMMVLLATAILLGLRLPRSGARRRAAIVLIAGAAVLFSAPVLVRTADDVRSFTQADEDIDPWSVARALQEVGLRPGHRVAILGHKDRHVFWARLARVRIVAQIPVSRNFRPPPPDLSIETRDALASSGAQIIVAREDALGTAVDPAKQTLGPTWRPLGTTRYWITWLTPSANATASSADATK